MQLKCIQDAYKIIRRCKTILKLYQISKYKNIRNNKIANKIINKIYK
jgi:hypothetical protein